MKFIKEHKISITVMAVCLILVILAGIAFYKMFYPSGGDAYGNRLNDAVAIDDAVISKIKENLIENGASEANYRTNVRIMKFFIKTELTSDKLEQLTKIIQENLNEKVTNYYDVEIYFTNESDKKFPVIAYQAKGTKKFILTFNKEVADDEK